MTEKTGPIHCQLAFLDPLFHRGPFIVEPHDRPARRLQVSHDEARLGLLQD